MNLVLVSDGASSGNGGSCAAGIVLYDRDTGQKISWSAKSLGDGTNTFAECMAMAEAIKWMIGYMQDMEEVLKSSGNVVTLTILADSVLVVNMVNERAKPRTNHTKEYLEEIMIHLKRLKACPGLKSVKVQHIGREFTHEADALAQEIAQAMQRKKAEAEYPFLNPKK